MVSRSWLGGRAGACACVTAMCMTMVGCSSYEDGVVVYSGSDRLVVGACAEVSIYTNLDLYPDGSKSTDIRVHPLPSSKGTQKTEITGQTEIRLSDGSNYVNYWTCQTTSSYNNHDLSVKVTIDRVEQVAGSF